MFFCWFPVKSPRIKSSWIISGNSDIVKNGTEPENTTDEPSQFKISLLRKIVGILLKMFPYSYMKDLWKQQNTVSLLS